MRTYEAKNNEGKTVKTKAKNKKEAREFFNEIGNVDLNSIVHVSKRELTNRRIAYLTSPESETYWCS